jgi:hypothetical protein
MRRIRFWIAACALVISAPAAAQRDTTVVARGTTQAVPAAVRAPLSPRRAFVDSFFVPGSAQSILGRHKAAAAMLLVEGGALLMIRESQADVREARQNRADSLVIVSYVDDEGRRLATPLRRPARFTDADVRARRNHVEDWIAILVANHLFAGAEAFVSANLWDRPPQLSIRRGPAGEGTTIGLAFTVR